jgi:aryl-alcohol dehydrogenase-like predicted oxidoreductase
MKKVKLGNSYEMVSTLCLGAMYLGTKQNKERSFTLLDQYTDAGGNFIDTANIYAHWVPKGIGGDSETCIGQWIKARRNREKVFIATKVGFPYQDVPHSLKADIIEEECNKSLKRMGLETIDLYYAHNDDRGTLIEETLHRGQQLSGLATGRSMVEMPPTWLDRLSMRTAAPHVYPQETRHDVCPTGCSK